MMDDLPIYDQITEASFNELRQDLTSFNNVLNRNHQTALYSLLRDCAKFLTNGRTGRHVYCLPTGYGKTASIIALISTLHRLGSPHSLVVCASKVEPLCDIKRTLIAKGVPEEKIGLDHSYEYKEDVAKAYMKSGKREMPKRNHASLPSTDDNDERPYLLTTHARVQIDEGIERYGHYQDKPRNLLVWDETLFKSTTHAIEKTQIEQDIGYLRPLARKHGETLWTLYEYLEGIGQLLEEELERLKQGGDSRVLPIEALEPGNLRRLKSELAYCARKNHEASIWLRLDTLLDILQGPVRMHISAQQDEGVLSYDIVVPRELEKIIVLDASHLLRMLPQMDCHLENCTPFPVDQMVTYENVTVHHLRRASGRDSMERSFRNHKREDRKVSLEVVDVVKGIPEDEAILIFCHKHRSWREPHIQHILRKDLKAAGINPNATDPQGRKRINILTWGEHESLNDFSYCQNVIFAGTLYRDHLGVAADILGQSEDIMADLSGRRVMGIVQNEAIHCIYQALNRGSSRVIKDGRASRMNAWLIFPKQEIRDEISAVMPGIRWVEWEPKHMLSQTKTDQITKQIEDLLISLPQGEREISKVEIRRRLGLDCPARTYGRALKNISEERCGWTPEVRRMVRLDSEHFFGVASTQVPT